MYQIIAPTLFQNKICRLPKLGSLVMVAHAAESDFVNGRIKPSFETIDFIAAGQDENLFNEFSAMSELLLKELNKNGSVVLPGIGTFTKANNAGIYFTAVEIDPVFNQAIDVERVIRQDAPHGILVGDQQRTNVEMTGFFNEQPTNSDRWWIWAIILAVVGIGALIVYFYSEGKISVGNSNYY